MASSGPRETTVRRLFALSMNRCAFPGCQTPIVDRDLGTIMAEVCHIHAQNEGGPRFDEAQTIEARHAIENLILMCRNHHKIIDATENLQEFPADRLREIKRAHESAALFGEALPEISDAVVNALRLSGTTYETGAAHIDFRQAEFHVGGEGGVFGGGGGGGGILTIIGIGRLPPDAAVQLDGQDGQVPGGGGGGGGSILFLGRPAEAEDRHNGLAVSAFLTANAVSVSGLLNLLGGGWSYYPVPALPHEVRLTFAYVVEFGHVMPSSLLRLDLVIIDPRGNQIASGSIDVEAPDADVLVRRVAYPQRIQFSAGTYGVWMAALQSGAITLASIPFEIRQGEEIQI